MAERKKNAIRNITWGVVNKVISVFTPFIARTIMIQTLGAEYLGLNSLFVSILQVLNITELGISSAIVYNMYRPIAEHDNAKINALLNFYKHAYRWIGAIILVVGLALMPVLDKIVDGELPADVNLYVLYSIFLLNTTISYWLFAYKKSLAEAFQRSDLISNVNSVVQVGQLVLQSIALIVFKNYYFYITIMVFATIVDSIMYEIISRMYFSEYKPIGKIDKSTMRKIKKNVGGLIVSRVCSMTRNSLDSIFISMFMGLTVVAIYNNYYSIMNSVVAFITVLVNSILAGIGNSVATETVEKNYNDMNRFNFYYMWLAGWTAICMLCLLQPFMEMWMGPELMLPFVSVVLFCLYYYCLKMGDIRGAYVVATGSWEYDRKRAIIETICNIILNVVLGKIWGVNGIIVATLISLFFVNFVYGSSIIFKCYFKKGIVDYFLYHLKYFLVTAAVGILTYGACSLVGLAGLTGVTGLIVKATVCLILPNVCFVIVYRKNKYYLGLRQNAMKIIKRRRE